MLPYIAIACITLLLFALGCLGIFAIDRRMRREDEEREKQRLDKSP